jgi:hypothetical protein
MIPVAPLHHIFDWFFEPIEKYSPERDDMFYYMHKSDPKLPRILLFLDELWNEVWHRNFGKYGRLTFNLWWDIRYFLQRLFRASHTSNDEMWDLCNPLAKKILPKLKAFRNYLDEHGSGYPTYFCDWNDDPKYGKYGWMGITKAQYMKDKKAGQYGGGGWKAWLKTVDEMIFAFEHILYMDIVESKEGLAFLKKYHLPNIWAKTRANRHASYYYRSKRGNFMSSGRPVKKSEEKKYTFLGKNYYYHNYEAEKKIFERAQKGLELFAKHFMSLGD